MAFGVSELKGMTLVPLVSRLTFPLQISNFCWFQGGLPQGILTFDQVFRADEDAEVGSGS